MCYVRLKVLLNKKRMALCIKCKQLGKEFHTIVYSLHIQTWISILFT